MDVEAALLRMRGFALVGGAGIAVNFAVFDLCRALTPLNVLASSLVGTGVAIVGNYFGFRHFTYRDRDKRCPGRQFTLFVVFSLVGLVIENGTLWVAAHELGRQGALESNLVKALGITAAATFRSRRAAPAPLHRGRDGTRSPPSSPSARS